MLELAFSTRALSEETKTNENPALTLKCPFKFTPTDFFQSHSTRSPDTRDACLHLEAEPRQRFHYSTPTTTPASCVLEWWRVRGGGGGGGGGRKHPKDTVCDRRARTLGDILHSFEDVTLVRSSSPKVASRPPRQHGLCNIRDGKPRTATSTFTQLLSSDWWRLCTLCVNLLACPAVKSYRWRFGSSLPCSRVTSFQRKLTPFVYFVVITGDPK